MDAESGENTNENLWTGKQPKMPAALAKRAQTLSKKFYSYDKEQRNQQAFENPHNLVCKEIWVMDALSRNPPPRCGGSGRRSALAVFSASAARCVPVPSKSLTTLASTRDMLSVGP